MAIIHRESSSAESHANSMVARIESETKNSWTVSSKQWLNVLASAPLSNMVWLRTDWHSVAPSTGHAQSKGATSDESVNSCRMPSHRT